MPTRTKNCPKNHRNVFSGLKGKAGKNHWSKKAGEKVRRKCSATGDLGSALILLVLQIISFCHTTAIYSPFNSCSNSAKFFCLHCWDNFFFPSTLIFGGSLNKHEALLSKADCKVKRLERWAEGWVILISSTSFQAFIKNLIWNATQKCWRSFLPCTSYDW